MTGGEITSNNAVGNAGGVRIGSSGTFTMTGGEISYNESTGGSGGGIYNSGTFTETASCAIYNNTAATSGDDIYNTGTLTLQSVYSGLTLDACQHAITGWYYDGLGDGSLTTRWLSHVTTEDKYCSEYTVSAASVTDSLALKAAHGGYHTITANYLEDGTGTTLAAATTVAVPDTEAYTVAQMSISGYAYVSADQALTIAATTDNVTINLYYEVSATEPDPGESNSSGDTPSSGSSGTTDSGTSETDNDEQTTTDSGEQTTSSDGQTTASSDGQATMSSTPSTGDDTSAAGWLVLALIGMSGIMFAARRRV
ncbi:MAG: hypothetical protein LUE90_07620 [Clostridiales bacterium]|nr:hypothetical protein [Clostridiales bacterium]